jgi:Na+-transporting NADH:ubiquinone oxidoreductase subunit NqrB
MITYANSEFGLRILTRVHGSALYKSVLPALISTVIYRAIAFMTEGSDSDELFLHPYPMQALVTAFTFLLVFRANYR